MKIIISMLLNVALLFAFVQAPSLHIHAHEATERHEGALLHTHVPHVEAPSANHPEWRDLDPDDDAQFLNWVSVAPVDEGLAPVALFVSAVVLPTPAVTEWQTTILRPSAHDPPTLAATPPRAPPV